MKKVFAILLVLISPLAIAAAQGLHGKILIVRDSVWQSENRVEALLPTIYTGMVDSTSSLPQDISQYDAILLFVDRPNGYPRDTISIEDEFRLIDYLKNGGRFYAEGTFFLSQYDDTLWRFMGLQFEGQDFVAVNYDRVHGVDSEFTKGIDTSWPQDPFGDDADYFPRGNITPVLFATADEDYIFGWIPSDRSIRAVIHHVDEKFIDSYYNPFLTRVLCDYFGLCVDVISSQPPVPQSNLRVVNDGIQTFLQVTGSDRGDIDVENELGIPVLNASANGNDERIAIPNNLANGVYFARLRMNGATQLRSFTIFQR